MTDPTDAEIEAVASVLRTISLPCDERCMCVGANLRWECITGDTPADIARAAILAHRKALAERGMVIVPREPTEAMLKACDDTFPDEPFNPRGVGFAAYRAMIDAAEARG